MRYVAEVVPLLQTVMLDTTAEYPEGTGYRVSPALEAAADSWPNTLYDVAKRMLLRVKSQICY